jgi:hypothetical protein
MCFDDTYAAYLPGWFAVIYLTIVSFISIILESDSISLLDAQKKHSSNLHDHESWVFRIQDEGCEGIVETNKKNAWKSLFSL